MNITLRPDFVIVCVSRRARISGFCKLGGTEAFEPSRKGDNFDKCPGFRRSIDTWLVSYLSSAKFEDHFRTGNGPGTEPRVNARAYRFRSRLDLLNLVVTKAARENTPLLKRSVPNAWFTFFYVALPNSEADGCLLWLGLINLMIQ